MGLAGQAGREPAEPSRVRPAGGRRRPRARPHDLTTRSLTTRPAALTTRPCGASRPDQAGDRLGCLVHLGLRIRPARFDGRGDAMAEMIFEQPQRDRLQCPGHRGYLGKHVDAILILLHHPLQAAYLPLDPAQALQIGVLVLGVTAHAVTIRSAPPQLPPRRPPWPAPRPAAPPQPVECGGAATNPLDV